MKKIEIPCRKEIVPTWPDRAKKAAQALRELYPCGDVAAARGRIGEILVNVTARFGDNQIAFYQDFRRVAYERLGVALEPYAVEAVTGTDPDENVCWFFRLGRLSESTQRIDLVAEVDFFQHAEFGYWRSIEIKEAEFDQPIPLEMACRVMTDFVHAVTMAMEVP